MQTVRSKSKKWGWKIRLNSVNLNLAPPEGRSAVGVKTKERRGKAIDVTIVDEFKSIVNAITCDDFKLWELKSQKFFDA